MAALNTKISGATLVETLVAITVLSLATAFAIIVFSKVSSPSSNISQLSIAQQQSYVLMDSIQKSDPLEKGFENQSFDYGNLHYTLIIEDYSQNLKQLTLVVQDNSDRKVYERKRLMYVEEGR